MHRKIQDIGCFNTQALTYIHEGLWKNNALLQDCLHDDAKMVWLKKHEKKSSQMR